MDVSALSDHAAAFVAGRPGYRWSVVGSGAAGTVLDGEITLLADPTRTARICVRPIEWVFEMTFRGHSDIDDDFVDFDEAEQVSALEGRIELAMTALRGPTLIIVDRVYEQVVASRMVVTPAGTGRGVDQRMSWPLRRLRARLLRVPISREVVDLPAVGV